MESPPEPCTGLRPSKGVLMIFSVFVSIKDIVSNWRDFPWPRPDVCPRCDGHGYGVMDLCDVRFLSVNSFSFSSI